VQCSVNESYNADDRKKYFVTARVFNCRSVSFSLNLIALNVASEKRKFN